MSVSPDGKGYWLVASDGGIFAFGDARFHGSARHIPGSTPIIGHGDGHRHRRLLAGRETGGVYAFNAPFYGAA